LAEYLPSGGGHVLITSRNPDWHELATPVSMEVFARAESISLLRRRVARLSEREADQIAASLGDLPLALSQAGAFLAETGCAVQNYLELLNNRATEILAHGTPVTYPTPLAASWQLAFDRLALDTPAALDLLTMAAQLAPEPIPFTLFTAHSDQLSEPLATVASDPLAFAGLTRLLRQRALARISADHFQLHRLVQAILRARSGNATNDDTNSAAVRLLREAVPDNPWNHPAAWPAWQRLLPHVLAATETGRKLDSAESDVAWLLDCAASYLHTRGEPRAALPLFQRAFQLYREVVGENHPSTLTAANHLASDLRALGRYEAARQLNEDTLIRSRQVLGNDHPGTLIAAHCLTGDLRAISEYEQARQLDEDTLIRRRRILGEDHPLSLSLANDLASDLRALGKYEQARQLDEDTLTRFRRVLGEDHPYTLSCANSLANDLRALGQYEQARQLNEDTLARRRRILGNNHPQTLSSANNLANDFRALGQYEQARQLDEDTLNRFRQVLGENHPNTLKSASHLATDLHKLGIHEQAHKLNEDTLARRRLVLGNDHPQTLDSAHSLVATLPLSAGSAPTYSPSKLTFIGDLALLDRISLCDHRSSPSPCCAVRQPAVVRSRLARDAK
jgi:hypothetical protein